MTGFGRPPAKAAGEPGDAGPGPLLEPGREGDLAGEDARRPADRMAASSSFLVGRLICEGLSADLKRVGIFHMDAAFLTDGRFALVFSLFSCGAAVDLGRRFDPKPLNSGTSSLWGVTGGCSADSDVLDGVRFGTDGSSLPEAGLPDRKEKLLGIGDRPGLEGKGLEPSGFGAWVSCCAGF